MMCHWTILFCPLSPFFRHLIFFFFLFRSCDFSSVLRASLPHRHLFSSAILILHIPYLCWPPRRLVPSHLVLSASLTIPLIPTSEGQNVNTNIHIGSKKQLWGLTETLGVTKNRICDCKKKQNNDFSSFNPRYTLNFNTVCSLYVYLPGMQQHIFCRIPVTKVTAVGGGNWELRLPPAHECPSSLAFH